MADLHRTDTPSTSTGAVKPAVTDGPQGKAAEAQQRANLHAEEAQVRSNARADAAAAKTESVVDRAEGKLERFKQDVQDGKHVPHKHSPGTGAHGQEQGAFLNTIGVPQQAGTAADAPGTGTACTAPLTSSGGGIEGPVAPTGAGGLVAGTGAQATSAGKPAQELSGTRKLAVNAADKAQEALLNAKEKLFGGPNA